MGGEEGEEKLYNNEASSDASLKLLV